MIFQETARPLKLVWITLQSDLCPSPSVQCNLPSVSYLGVLQAPPSYSKRVGLNKMDILVLTMNRSTYTWMTVQRVKTLLTKQAEM